MSILVYLGSLLKYNRRRFLIFATLGSVYSLLLRAIFRQEPVYSQPLTQAEKLRLNADEEPLLRFVAVADTGTGDRHQYAVAEAMERYYEENPFSLVILAGDNIYSDGDIDRVEDVFERPYGSLLQKDVKFHACLGNHDIRTDNGNPQVAYPGFHMQGRTYTVRYNSVQFFALDTTRNADWESQLAWLEQELRQSDAPWKIVFGHHPIYSSGMYGTNIQRVRLLKPLFQKYGVQLYMNGHEHNYERTLPIDGTTYLICGAGAKSRPVGRSQWTVAATSRLSFAACEVYRDYMTIRGIDTENRVFDRGAIPVSPNA